jgi:dephospho-CoA kinase
LTLPLLPARLEAMITIALTGGIGSGKSTVSAILKELGAVVIDSDQAAREVLETSALAEVTEAFGGEILTERGTIDRKKLALIVFNNPAALAQLNKIIHTRLEIEIVKRLESLKQQGTGVVAIELALISEAPWARRADYTWIVQAPREVVLARLRQRGMSEADALARMAAQKPAEQSVEGAKVIIENKGSRAKLKEKVEKLWEEIHNKDMRAPLKNI